MIIERQFGPILRSDEVEQTLNLKHLSVRYRQYIIVRFTYYITTTFLEINKCVFVLKPNKFFTFIVQLNGILFTVFFIPYHKREIIF